MEEQRNTARTEEKIGGEMVSMFDRRHNEALF